MRIQLSRETDPSATHLSEHDPDRYTATPNKNTYREIGNPEGRVPFDSPEGGGDSGSREKEEGLIGTGNADIRVPEIIKSVEGLCVGEARKEEEDAERLDHGEKRIDDAKREGDGEPSRRSLEWTAPRNTLEAPAEGQEGPEKPEPRHVPGGTWLKQRVVAFSFNCGSNECCYGSVLVSELAFRSSA
ncbi:hypothetical protein NDU88_004491 [Pleurodeles waltl]|uniref:Uncharacterized protein n=1 Tax=Pleurodeles waltl TaxID=8319 RepID=A0AAV7W8E4_PLEWA|nr:hypothetical protein NDU88_004491 [Pleurodeles waltl]